MMPRSYDELFPEDAAPPSEPLADPEPVEDLYTGPPTEAELREMAQTWDADPTPPPSYPQPRYIRSAKSYEDRRAEREAREMRERADALAADKRRIAFIQAGNDERQPPERRGNLYEHEDKTHNIVIHLAIPPATIGVPAESHPDFRDFQNWGSRNQHQDHPEYYCVECRWRYAAPPRCPTCKSTKLNTTGERQADHKTMYRCRECSAWFGLYLMCGPCISDLIPEAEQPRLVAAKRKPSGKGRQKSPVEYPD
jgi:hypothetical protein